jgi:hypothetical protein
MNTYTVFCREVSNTGTTWIGAVEAESVDEAKLIGANTCAWCWGQENADGIRVVGIAAGDVQIIDWDDGE